MKNIPRLEKYSKIIPLFKRGGVNLTGTVFYVCFYSMVGLRLKNFENKLKLKMVPGVIFNQKKNLFS